MRNSIPIAADTAGQLVPKEELLRNARPTETLSSFTEWAKMTRMWIDWENRNEEMIRHRKWYKCVRFFEGKQLSVVSPTTGAFRDLNPGPKDPLYVNNMYRFNVRSILKEAITSNPEILVKGRADGSFEIEGGARAAKSIGSYYQRKMFNVYNRQREWLFRLLCGNSIRYHYWSASAGSKKQVPIFEQQEIQLGQQSFQCPACGTSDYLPQGAQGCPSCGNPGIDTIGGQSAMMPIQTGVQTVRSGEQVGEIPDPTEFKFSLYANTPDESPYVRRRRLLIKDVVDLCFPWMSYSFAAAQLDITMSMQDLMRRSAGNISTLGGGWGSDSYRGSLQNRLVPFDQYWLDPLLYARYITPEKIDCGNGMVIPPRTALIEVFPDGWYQACLGDVMVDQRPENKADVLTHCPYIVVPTRVWGDGTEDAVEQQRQLNELDSLTFENIMNCDGPPTVINPLKISRAQMSGKPHEIIVLKNPTLTDEPQKYIVPLAGRPLPQEVMLMRASLKRDMGSAFGVTSVMSGLEDSTQTKTASGTADLIGEAQKQQAVAYMLHADMECEFVRQVHRSIQKNADPERYVSVVGEHSQYEIQAFFALDLDSDVEYEVRQHSWIPRDAQERKNDMLEALTAGGIPGGVYSPMFPPDARNDTIKALNVPFDFDKQVVGERNQRIEIAKMRATFNAELQRGLNAQAQMAQMPGQLSQGIPPATDQPGVPMGYQGLAPDSSGGAQDQGVPQDSAAGGMDQHQGGGQLSNGMPPMGPEQQAMLMAAQQAAQSVQVKPFIDDHASHIMAIQKYMNTDKGMNDPPAFQAVLMQHLEQHLQAKAMADMQIAQLQMMAQGGMPGAPGQPPPGEQGGKPPQAGPPAAGQGQPPGQPQSGQMTKGR